MNIRTAIAGLALLGMIGFVASTADAQCSASKSKASCSSKTSADKAACTSKASADKASCSAECAKSCGSHTKTAQACNYSAEECEKWMREHYESHGWLGIEMNMDGTQPVVTKVVESSPAEAAGFKVGDTLTSINGIGFASGNDGTIKELMKNGFKVGDNVTYTAQREREIVTLTARLTAISDETLSNMIATHLNSPHKATEKAENLN